MSFRSSFAKAVQPCDVFVQQKLLKLLELISFSDREFIADQDPFLGRLARSLQRVDRQTHRSLVRLIQHREQIRIEESFRRKSGQALRQTRVQSLITSLLYLGLLFYVLRTYSVGENLSLILGSVVLFMVGSAFMWLKGRSFVWKV